MRIQPNSKTLRKYEDDRMYAIKYHKTMVLDYNKHTGILFFQHDGWITVNTARAMNFGLNDIGLPDLVRYSKKDNQLYLNINGEEFPIKDGMKIAKVLLEELCEVQ